MLFSTFRILAVLCCLANVCAEAAPGDENWADGFGAPPGLNGEVYCSRVIGSDLFVGGAFTKAGEVDANNIARWDGHEWHAVGAGVYGRVFAIAVHRNALYVGGDFFSADEGTEYNVAKWTGTQWEDIAGAARDHRSVYALASSGGNLYVGGSFDEIHGVPAANIARWDGIQWYPLRKGVGYRKYDGSLGAGAVSTILVNGSHLYVGGVFERAGQVRCNNIARWDGYNWRSLGQGIRATNSVVLSDGSFAGMVYALAMHEYELYIGGNFSTAGTIAARNIAKWNGSGWKCVTSQSTGLGDERGFVRALASRGRDLFVAGSFHGQRNPDINNIARLNGLGWHSLSSGVQGPVYTLSSSVPGVLYCGGRFGSASGRLVGHVAGWNASEWLSLGDAFPGTGGLVGYVSSIAVASNEVYVAGNLFTAGKIEVTDRTATLAGTNWSSIENPGPNSLGEIVASGGKIYTWTPFSFPGVSATNLACWNGQRWAAVGNDPQSLKGMPTDVTRICSDGQNLYVFGYDREKAGRTVAVWNGETWRNIGQDLIWPEYATAMAAGGGRLFISIFAPMLPTLLEWDGAKWEAIEPGPLSGGTVYKIAVNNHSLFVSGFFENRATLAMWDGSRWSTLESGWLTSMVGHGSSLYVSGFFSEIGGIAANNIAHWDGVSWHALGSGLNFPASCMAIDDRKLCVGSGFSRAGDKPSYNFGIWNVPPGNNLSGSILQ
jgi:hypothetical protein